MVVARRPSALGAMLLSTLVIMSAMVLLLVALKPGRLATMGPSAAIIGLRRPRCQGRGPGQAISQPHNRPGRLPPGTMPMEHPSRATFNRVQADPSLPERDASIVAEFEAAPWLLPPRTKALTYTGVHNLGQLLELRATPFGKHPKTMTLLTLNKQFAVMTQNTIYSMVKFGGVRNYIVATWDPGDLAACADLNLPCADVTRFLPEPMNRAQDAGAFGSHDYLVVCWLRSFLLTHLLRQGFVVFSTDSDISYFLKPVWESYMRFMEEAGADAAFQTEAPLNGGNYCVLPTRAAIKFAASWAALARPMIKEGLHDQHGFSRISSKVWSLCESLDSCQQARAKHKGKNTSVALIRRYLPGFLNYWDHLCALGGPPLGFGEQLPTMDPCDWFAFYLHPICANSTQKEQLFKLQGVWHMDEQNCGPRNSSSSQVNVCQPLRWRVPATEAMLYACPAYGVALTHRRPQRQPLPAPS